MWCVQVLPEKQPVFAFLPLRSYGFRFVIQGLYESFIHVHVLVHVFYNFTFSKVIEALNIKHVRSPFLCLCAVSSLYRVMYQVTSTCRRRAKTSTETVSGTSGLLRMCTNSSSTPCKHSRSVAYTRASYISSYMYKTQVAALYMQLWLARCCLLIVV